MDGRSFMLQEHYRVISYNIKNAFVYPSNKQKHQQTDRL